MKGARTTRGKTVGSGTTGRLLWSIRKGSTPSPEDFVTAAGPRGDGSVVDTPRGPIREGFGSPAPTCRA